MYQIKIDGSRAAELLLPRMSNVVKNHVIALAKMINCPVDVSLKGMILANAGCLRMPLAGLAITGTSCAAPLLRTEADRISRLLDCDMLLLRCEGVKGINLDIRLSHKDRWLGGYLPWINDGELWLVPIDNSLPALEVFGGLFERSSPPFTDDQSRSAGLDRASRAFADLARRSL